MKRLFALLLLALAATAAAAQGPVETQSEALAEDARIYASQHRVSDEEALARLRAQQASVAATDAIRAEFASRLAGISIEHEPQFRIVVLLTGPDPVPERTIPAGGMDVPIVFRTGARATHEQAVTAMRRHLIDLRTELPGERGAGYDQRTGEVVLLVRSEDVEKQGIEAVRQRAEQLSGVPVRIAVNQLIEQNMAVAGGGYVTGMAQGHRLRCTSGFVVTDGSRDAIATAAHCPDELTFHDEGGVDVPLAFSGQWGLAYQDVQINLSPQPLQPLFYSDRKAGALRELTSWRNMASTRAGDFVCHYGESSGYSCAEVELTDYAPPDDLCGGPCEPTWVTVNGPTCIPGDSGGPVFSGGVAFGIAKGINRTNDGKCNFYYYMSTDLLPQPWSLKVAPRPSG